MSQVEVWCRNPFKIDPNMLTIGYILAPISHHFEVDFWAQLGRENGAKTCQNQSKNKIKNGEAPGNPFGMGPKGCTEHGEAPT